jgi:signal transduction histidine kinase
MRTHHGDIRHAWPQAVQPPDSGDSGKRRLARARLAGAAQERERLARDLHDGVQNQLVTLIIGLSHAEEDRDTPPTLAARLSGLRAQAQATLTEIRQIARGNRPLLLTAAGVIEAIREQTERTSLTVGLFGSARRSSDATEEAVYFACLEALQNVAN